MSAAVYESADWAAVHHADRAVRVAWVSAVVNFLVVLVALGTPLIQRQIDLAKDRESSYAAKDALVREAISVYQDGTSSRSLLHRILDPQASPPGSDDRSRLETLDELNQSFGNLKEETELLFRDDEKDFGYRTFVAALISRINHLQLATRRTSFLIKNKNSAGTELLLKGSQQFDEQYDADLAQIKLLIGLNYDSSRHSVKRESVRYGECTDQAYAAECAAPLRI